MSFLTSQIEHVQNQSLPSKLFLLQSLHLSEMAHHNPVVQPKALLTLMLPASLLALLLPIYNVSPNSIDSTSKLCPQFIRFSPTPLLSPYFPSLPSLTWITAAASQDPSHAFKLKSKSLIVT